MTSPTEASENSTTPTPTEVPRVGFIGLGNIGKPMAKQLINWPGGLVVCDVVPEVTASFASRGALVAETPEEVGKVAPIVSVMVRDDAQVREVCAGLFGSMAPGGIIAIHSTIAIETATSLATEAVAYGISILDAPVSGGAIGASQGRLAVMVGGSEEATERFRQVACWADLVVHMGPIGAGTQAKLARNMLHFTAFCAVHESLQLAEACGIDLQALGQIVRHSDAVTGGPGAIMLRDRTGLLAEDDGLRPIFEHTATLGRKDLHHALALADAQELDLPLARIAATSLAHALGVTVPTTEDV